MRIFFVYNSKCARAAFNKVLRWSKYSKKADILNIQKETFQKLLKISHSKSWKILK